MSQNGEWANIKTQYLASLPSQSKIIKTKTLFTHLDSFLMENNLPFKDLSHNRDNFKAYLQNKVSKTSFQVYWSYFIAFYSWLESNYLRVEPASQEAKPEPPKTISKLQPEAPPATFDLDKWISERNYTCPDCQSQPFKDKDGLWCVICPKPKEWKEGKYGTLRPTKGAKGKINIEICQNTQAFIINRKIKPDVQPTEEAETEGIDLSRLPKIAEPTIGEIVDQVGVCENPILARQRHGSLACVLCRKRVPQKWQACQEIQKELKASPVAFDKFAKAMRERLIEEKKAGEDPYWWWQAPKTEDMTLEEIEEELGLRQPSKSRRISCTKFCSDLKIMNCEKYPSCELNTGISEPEELDVFDIAEKATEPLRFSQGKAITEDQPVSQELFDAIRKRYHEICENCEEHIEHRCTSYCKEFWESLPSEMKAEALKLKRYPSEEVTALREPLRKRLKEIVPEEGIEE